MKTNVDEYLMIDCDMFLVDNLDLNIYRKYQCACVIQERPDFKYFWPNFFYINMNTIPNVDLLDLSILPEGDTGSASSVWLKSVDFENNSNFYLIKHLHSLGWNENNFPEKLNKYLLDFLKFDLRNENGLFFSEIYDNKFLHYRAGSNWMIQSRDLHEQTINKLFNSIHDIIT